MAREKCGLLAVPFTVPVQLMRYPYTAHDRPWEWNAVNAVGLHQNAQSAILNQYFNTAGYACAMQSAWNPKDNYGISASVYGF